MRYTIIKCDFCECEHKTGKKREMPLSWNDVGARVFNAFQKEELDICPDCIVRLEKGLTKLEKDIERDGCDDN